jgi:transketolase
MDLAAALYLRGRARSRNPNWPDRDRIIWSAGHKAPALYVSLGMAGFCPARRHGHAAQARFAVSGTSALAQIAGRRNLNRLARPGAERRGRAWRWPRASIKEHKIFCLMGDGEQQEGQVWEAAMEAGHFHLDNIIAVIDCNRLQIDGWVKGRDAGRAAGEKYASFGWEVLRIDGHDMSEIVEPS